MGSEVSTGEMEGMMEVGGGGGGGWGNGLRTADESDHH